MFEPVRMLKINILVHEKYLEQVTEELGAAGAIHLGNAAAQSRDRLLHSVDCEEDINALQGLYSRCRELMVGLGLPEAAAAESGAAANTSVAEMNDIVAAAEAEFRTEDEAINTLIAESGTLVRDIDRLERYPFRRVRLGDLRDLNHFYIATGRLHPASLVPLAQALGEKALVLHQKDQRSSEEHVLVAASRKSRWAVESELGKFGFVEETPLTDQAETVEAQQQLSAQQLTQVREAIEEHRRNLQQLAGKYREPLTRIATALHRMLAVQKAKQHFGRAANLYCISGWVPREKSEAVARKVEEITHGTGVIERIRPEDDPLVKSGAEVVPVQFRQNRALKPFQRLISGFGAPRYQEVEPSLFVALSFVLMFGIMFGDVGQGAVIMLGGALLLRSRKAAIRKFRDLGYMLIFCGAAAMVFGFLYGSLFGAEGLLPRLWISPLHDVMSLLKAAIVVGIVCISVGILLNIYNRFRAHDYFHGVFDKFGVIGIVFYWGSIGLGLKALMAGSIRPAEVLLVIVLPLLVLFLREPLYNLLQRKKKILHEDVFTFLVSSAVEVLETVTVFLGSTVSFVRVGAFALSHAALCLAVFAMVESIRNLPGQGLWSLLIVILGNLFVIFLEGMVVTIQGIRLQYYELFSKYFAGDGVLYQPFQLTDGNEKGGVETVDENK